jgi:hypothetical protein
MATEFLCTRNLAGETHSTLDSWGDDTSYPDGANWVDYTSAATKVFSHGGKTGTLIAPGDNVTGKTSGATGVCVFCTDPTSHTSISVGQILIYQIGATPFSSGEQVYETLDTNYVVISDAGDSAIAVLELHSDDGEMDDYLFQDTGVTADSTNYRKIRANSSDRRTSEDALRYGFSPSVNNISQLNTAVFEIDET